MARRVKIQKIMMTELIFKNNCGGMKLITFLSLFFVVHWTSLDVIFFFFNIAMFARSAQIYDDFTKIECSSSPTCTSPYCNLSQGNELNNSISFGCELQRSLSPVSENNHHHQQQQPQQLIKLRLKQFSPSLS
jgi:hypothetical protein